METAWVFFLEAGVAMGLLIFIVWWTMFSRPDMAKRPPPKVEETPQEQAKNEAMRDTSENEHAARK